MDKVKKPIILTELMHYLGFDAKARNIRYFHYPHVHALLRYILLSYPEDKHSVNVTLFTLFEGVALVTVHFWFYNHMTVILRTKTQTLTDQYKSSKTFKNPSKHNKSFKTHYFVIFNQI
jgi:hypothetical protein